MTPVHRAALFCLLSLGLGLWSGCATASRAATAVEGAIDGTYEAVREKVLRLIEPKSEKFRRALLDLATGGPDQRREAIVYLDQEWAWSSTETRSDFGDLLANRVVGDSDELVRAVAVRALRRYSGPKVTQALTDALNDRNDFVRIEAARSLSGTQDANAAAVLLKRLRTDPNPQVRAAAAAALGGARTRRVLLSLIEALNDDDLVVVRSSTDSLVRLTGEYRGDTREEWDAWLRSASDPFADALPPPTPEPDPEAEKSFWQRVLSLWPW